MKNHRSASIVRRLAAWYILSVFATACVGFAYVQWSLRHLIGLQSIGMISDRLESVLQTLETADNPSRAINTLVENVWPKWKFERVWAEVKSADGKVRAETPGIEPGFHQRIFSQIPIVPITLGPVPPRSSRVPPVRVVDSSDSGKVYLVVAAQPEILGVSGKSPRPFQIFLALDVSRGNAIMRDQAKQTVLALLGLLVLCSLIGTRVSSAAFEPVRKVIRAATQITSANLHERLPVEDLPEEIRVLAATVNEMLGRIQESFLRLSRFSSDIAHELRTPLNNLRGEIEVTLSKERASTEYREALYSVLEEGQRLGRIIESLLFLAVVEAPDRQLKKEVIPLRAEVENLADFHSAHAVDQSTHVKIRIADDIKVIAERTLFQRVVSNLLSNAIRHSGGNDVIVEASQNRDHVLIEVRDLGSGIAAEDLPHVFDRFYRADPSRRTGESQGFGLGLTIVRTIVQLHRGEVSIRSREGEGTSVFVSLPT